MSSCLLLIVPLWHDVYTIEFQRTAQEISSQGPLTGVEGHTAASSSPLITFLLVIGLIYTPHHAEGQFNPNPVKKKP
jgi:hypothetical protein